jgi:hypothetical protein
MSKKNISKKINLVGKKVIVRANVAGVHMGVVTALEGHTVVLKNARRLWRYYTRDRSGSVSDVAVNGLPADKDNYIGAVLPSVTIVNPAGLELAEMTTEAYKQIMAMETR